MAIQELLTNSSGQNIAWKLTSKNNGADDSTMQLAVIAVIVTIRIVVTASKTSGLD